MSTESMSCQMTVKQLRLILHEAQENAAVALRLPAGYVSNPKFEVLVNLQIEDKGPIVLFTPRETMSFTT